MNTTTKLSLLSLVLSLAPLCLAMEPDSNENLDGLLLKACAQGDLASVENLLNAHVDVNATDPFGNTPLHAAAMSGSSEVVKMLLAYNANVNATMQGDFTPLFVANLNGEDAEVAQLLEQWPVLEQSIKQTTPFFRLFSSLENNSDSSKHDV